MLDSSFSMAGLQDTASAALLFTGTSLVLALVVAVVLGVLDELALRRWVHLLATRWWLERIVPSEGEKSRTTSAEVKRRQNDLLLAFEPAATEAPVGDKPPPPQEGKGEDSKTKDVFWQLVMPVAGLTSRQLMGNLSSGVQAELGNRHPSPFVCWLAALGSMPIQPSPFKDLKPCAEPTPTFDDQGAPGAARSLQATALDLDNTAARETLQAYTERALDSLQVQLLRTRTILRHTFAAILVAWLVLLLAAQAYSEAQVRVRNAEMVLAMQAATRVKNEAARSASARASGATDTSSLPSGPATSQSGTSASLPTMPTAEEVARLAQLEAYKAHRNRSLLLYLALSIVATAFVSVLSGPLDRLTATRNG